ncbi:MAG TPA: RES family NAD+ phosphorylase [Gaiellaceae bacterium]|nr:RES family NAD+ phosphorylase [Gaiellaceae bacterium]
MVRIDPPPPSPRRLLRPVHRTLPSGTDLFRIYDPLARHGPRDARQFRYVGPFARFDHHRGTGRRERRGIWYAGLTLDVAVVEAFDVGVVEPRGERLARLRTSRELLLLDLHGRAAMRSGTVAAISASDHSLAQAWSRYWYDESGVFGELDGLYYPSAHNGEPAVALYERGRTALELPRGQVAPLTDPDVLTEIRRIGLAHSLLVLLPS